MLYKHKCLTVLRCTSQTSRNTLLCWKGSRLTQAEVPSQCLQVECAKTKSNTVYKKGSYNSTNLQGKITMSDDFELGEDEMEPTSSVTLSLSLHITGSLGWASQNRPAFVFIKHIHFFFFFKWQIVSLDKTLIHRLVSFRTLWSCTETVILTLNRLESIEVTIWSLFVECFHQKPTFIFDWRKKYINMLDDTWVSKL